VLGDFSLTLVIPLPEVTVAAVSRLTGDGVLLSVVGARVFVFVISGNAAAVAAPLVAAPLFGSGWKGNAL
jgi:hypothetical protein